jgi:hypothetical protein
MDRRFLIFLTLLILVSSSAIALTPDEKIYFDQQNQKTVAQINAKIDSTSNRIEQNVEKKFLNAQAEIKAEVTREMNSALKGVGVGMVGIIIVALAVFKVIDLKLTSTRNIKKYEDQLNSKIKEMDKIISDHKVKSERLNNYRVQLINYHQQVNAFAQGYGVTPQAVNVPLEVPKPAKKKRFRLFKRKNGSI